MVHGEFWTIRELFVYPNEYIYWTIQIVMYPFMTGLVAGAFVLSSLYHVFGIKQLKDIARFALVFSFALLFVAPMPLLLHLQHPLRGINVFMTPHFTSAIAAFGIVFSTYCRDRRIGTVVHLSTALRHPVLAAQGDAEEDPQREALRHLLRTADPGRI